jgi:hypothetical protein
MCSIITQWSESHRTCNHTSHLRLAQTWRARFPYLYPSGTGVAQFYHRSLGSLYVASYDSQDYGGGIVTCLYTGFSERLNGLSLNLALEGFSDVNDGSFGSN